MRAKTKLWLNLILVPGGLSLALFLSAGTFRYWQAWAFLVVNSITSILVTRFIANDPVLLENRTKAGPTAEQRPLQKLLVWLLMPVWMAAFIVPGLDRRFRWSEVPPAASVLGDVSILLSMWFVYRVFKENAFGAATVEIAKDQRVISTGPYAFVRHPMYSGATLYFVASALALASYWALVPAVLMLLGFVVRLFDEERFLSEHLPGYRAYCTKVRWRLMPGIF